MPRRVSFPLWVLIGAVAAGPAMGAISGETPKKRYLTPLTKAIDAGLRGPLDAPVAAPPSAKPPPLVLPGPGASLAGLDTAGFASARPITPLRVVGDPAPICRAECAKARVFCAAGQDLDCDTHWIQCVSDCSIGSLR